MLSRVSLIYPAPREKQKQKEKIIKTPDRRVDRRTRFSGAVGNRYSCLRLRFPSSVVLCVCPPPVRRTENKKTATRYTNTAHLATLTWLYLTTPTVVCNKHESVRRVLGGGVHRAGAGAADGVGSASELARGGRGGERGGQRCRRRRFGPVQRTGALGGGHIRHAGQEVGRSGVRVEGDQPSEPGGGGPVRGGRHTASDRHGPERAEGCVVQVAQGHHPVRDQPLFL